MLTGAFCNPMLCPELGLQVHNQTVPGKGKIMKYGLYTCRGTCQCGTEQYQNKPGGNGHEAKDTAWLADAGADYLKVDSCCGYNHFDIICGTVAPPLASANTGSPLATQLLPSAKYCIYAFKRTVAPACDPACDLACELHVNCM